MEKEDQCELKQFFVLDEHIKITLRTKGSVAMKSKFIPRILIKVNMSISRKFLLFQQKKNLLAKNIIS